MSSGRAESSRNSAALSLMAIASLLLVCAASYSNSLAGPFVYDDHPNIQNNQWIQIADLHPQTLWHAGMESRCTRPVAYMSFALNYYFGGLEVRGYHIVNTLVHAISGILLYWLAIDCFRRQRRLSAGGSRSVAPELAALLAAAIFIAHPIQVQSITYIVQRMSSMAAMFCLLAFVLFIWGRDREGGRRIAFWLAAGFAWLLALGTKQTAMPLPLLCFVYEWYFRQDLSWAWLRRHWGLLAGALAIMGLVSSYFLLSDHEISYDLRYFSLAERLLTQPRVVMRYIDLLLYPLPSRLNLLHDVPVSVSLFEPATTLLALLALLALGFLALGLAPRYRLLSFSIVWFFVTLSIESSFISLELMFEHRLYLPMVGFAMLAASGIVSATRGRAIFLAPISLLVVALLGGATHQRNEIWRSNLALWEDTVAKSPEDRGALNNLGNELRHSGRLDEAEGVLLRSVAADPQYFRAWWNLAAVAQDRDDPDEMIRYLRRAGAVLPVTERANPYIATAHRRLAKIFIDRQQWGEALLSAEEDLRLDPTRPLSLVRVAWLLATHAEVAGADLARAIELAERADALTEHAAPRVIDTLATVYAAAGRFEDAARVTSDLLELELAEGGGREGVIRERLARYRAAASLPD